jgi:double-stranded uracil-DNA glycosylase
MSMGVDRTAAVPMTVTPNEIAKRLAVTGLRFRNWLREQKDAGHPLVASHVYRSRYHFTPAQADQLAAEFVSQVLGASGTRARATSPSTRASRSGRARARPTQAQTRHPTGRGSQVDPPRSDDPGHRVTVEWMGEEVETLADLLRSGPRTVAIGINPTPRSVAAGHYYQGKSGQTFFRRLSRAGLLPDGDGFQDDRSFVAGTGFTDVVKRPTPSEQGLRPGELEHGRTILEAKLTTLDVPLVIFVFKGAAETLLGALPPHSYGLVPHRRIGHARVFVMPGPMAASAIEFDAIKKLQRALRATL